MGGGGGRGSAAPSVTPARRPPNPAGAAGPHPTTHPRGPRAEAPPGARLPLLGAHPLLLVATKSRSESCREGAGSGRGGTPSAAGGSQAKKWGGGNKAGGICGPARGQPAQKYAEGPLPGPGTQGESASPKFGGGGCPGGVDGCTPRGARRLSGRHLPSGPAFVSRVSSSCCVRPPPAAAAAEAPARAEGRKGRRRRGRPRRGVPTGLWETGCAPESRSGSSRRCCC